MPAARTTPTASTASRPDTTQHHHQPSCFKTFHQPSIVALAHINTNGTHSLTNAAFTQTPTTHASMREGVATLEDHPPLAGGSGTSNNSDIDINIETSNTLPLYPIYSTLFDDNASVQLPTVSVAYAPPASTGVPNSDDDTEMLDQGGVSIAMDSTFADELNSEMDTIDAEIMGPHNLAAIAITTALDSTFGAGSHDMGFISQEQADAHHFVHDIDNYMWNYSAYVNGQGDPIMPIHVAHPGEIMAEVSQQLQQLQDGQDMGELVASALPHGALHDIMEDSLNLNMADFLANWGAAATRGSAKKKRRGPHLRYLEDMSDSRPTEIRRSDLRGERCDFQGINWKQLEVTRNEARKMRSATYKNYTNLKAPTIHATILRHAALENTESYFKFRRMDLRHQVHLVHFQLRNLLACTSRNSIFYAGENRVVQANPQYGLKGVRMDLTNPEIQASHHANWAGIQISTLAADHNILVAGGYYGEYAMLALDQPDAKHTEGLVLDHMNSITNHVQIQLNRQSGTPQAAIASNDCGFRTLDCATNTFVAHHQYDHAINCSAISPDHRLRVLVGDDRDAMICSAESGKILQSLDGHVDYGFACAWADNGWHVATGNQDKLIKIWDARKWTNSDGKACPLQNIATQTAGARSLKFSPVGGGKRVLVAAEPADIISVIDAESYESKQTIDFFGEIAGFDFSPDGQELFVGVHDSMRGGIMEFEKCGFSQVYGREAVYYTEPEENYDEDRDHRDMAAGLDWRRTTKEVVDDPRSSRTALHRRRKAAFLGDMEPF